MGNDDITIYWGSGSGPCWRALLGVEEKGLKYESKLISFDKKGHKSPEIMALNPRGQVPTFKHGDIIVNESMAICHYLEEVFKDKGTRLIPENPKDKALVLQRAYEASNLETKMKALYLPVMQNKVEEMKDEMPALKQKLADELAIWDGYLSESDGDYIGGKSFSLVDVFFFPQLAFCWRFGLKFDTRPGLKKYFEVMKARPTVKSTWPPHWNETDNQTHFIDV